MFGWDCLRCVLPMNASVACVQAISFLLSLICRACFHTWENINHITTQLQSWAWIGHGNWKLETGNSFPYLGLIAINILSTSRWFGNLQVIVWVVHLMSLPSIQLTPFVLLGVWWWLKLPMWSSYLKIRPITWYSRARKRPHPSVIPNSHLKQFKNN